MEGKNNYWYLRLKEDFFRSDEMIIMQSMKDGYLYSDILLKMYLASLGDGGRLMFRDLIPYSPEMLATITGHSVGTVEKAVSTFKQLGLVEIMDSGAIYMSDIQNMIGKSSTEADRKREYRQRISDERREQKKLVNSGAKDRTADTDIEETSPKKVGYTNDFESLWKIYPRKKEKGGAYEKYKARINDGYSHEELMEATRAYANECKKNHTEERYIKQGKTFFGPNTPFLDYLRKEEARGCTEATGHEASAYRKILFEAGDL